MRIHFNIKQEVTKLKPQKKQVEQSGSESDHTRALTTFLSAGGAKSAVKENLVKSILVS